MDNGINKIETVEREACYLIDTIERTLERIINYNDLTEEELKINAWEVTSLPTAPPPIFT